MNDVESRLSDAYREAAATVRPEELRSLQLEQQAGERATAGSRRGRSLTPLVAAAAVLAVVVAAAVAVPLVLSGHRDGHQAASGGRSIGTRHGAPITASLPEYVVANDGSQLAIIATATWKTVAQVPAPSGQAFTAVAGAADDRTFVVAADLSVQSSCDAWLYRLRLNGHGQPASGLSLVVPRMSGLPTSIALSADANTAAYSVVHCASGKIGHIGGSHPIGDIGVINLATTQVKQWSFSLNEDYTSDLSLSANGGLAGFSSYLDTAAPATVQAGRVLAASSQPGTVQQRDRIVVRSPATANNGLDAVALSPDGHTLYACTQSGSSQNGTEVTQTLAAYAVATGRATSVVRTWRTRDPSCSITADPTGGYLLLSTTATSGNRAPGTISPPSSKAKKLGGHRPVTVLEWVNLRIGSITRLPITVPLGAGLGL
jgi:hypothetical protein